MYDMHSIYGNHMEKFKGYFLVSLFGGQPPVHGACGALRLRRARRHDDTTTTTL